MRQNLTRNRTIAATGLIGIAALVVLGGMQVPTPSVLDGIPVEQLVRGPQGPPYVPREPIAVVGGLLIDATGAAPKQAQTILIEGELTTEGGPMGDACIAPG